MIKLLNHNDIQAVNRQHQVINDIQAVDDKDDTDSRSYWCDGFRVTQEMYNFTQALRETDSKIRFAATSEAYQYGASNYMLMYREGASYSYGTIMTGTCWGKRTANDMQYVVQHDSIHNDKYTSKPYYNRLYSNNLKTAVKNVRKYCIPPTPVQIAYATKDMFTTEFDKVVASDNRYISDVLFDAKTSHSAIITEIKNLQNQGAVFVTEAFNKILNDIDKLYALNIKLNTNAAIPVYHAEVQTIGDNQFIHLVEALMGPRGDIDTSKNQMTTLHSNDVPEDIMGRLAVLTTFNVGQHVPDVGMRVAENLFWMYRDTL